MILGHLNKKFCKPLNEMGTTIELRKSNGTYFWRDSWVGRLQPPDIRATEVAPTHEGRVGCSFIYAKLSNKEFKIFKSSSE